MVVLGGLLVLLAVAGLSLITAAAIRRQFEQGKAHLTRAQSSLVAGDLDVAAASFAMARRSFRDAGDHPGVFLLRAEGLLPFLGRTPDALLSLSHIGENVSAVGEEVSRALAALPGGLSALGLSDGRIPIAQLRSLAPSVRRAKVALDAIEAEADRLPDSWLLEPVAEARDLVRSRLAAAVPLARSADALLGSLPAFAGQDAPRRYFVAIQNSAELRGTGGLIGNYSILTIDHGQLSLGPFRDTQSLANVPASTVPMPSPDFEDLYGPFGGGGFWLNINMTPDAPTAAGLIEDLYLRVRGEPLDGTIFFDLHGLEQMLQATGPVRIDPLGVAVDADTVLQYVATAGYLGSGIGNPFSQGPRLIADAIWGRFLEGVDPETALRSLVEMAAQGHLVLHAADPDLQAAFRSAGVAGELRPGDGDFVGLVLNNAAANKVDLFLREEIRYEVSLGPEGSAGAEVTVRLANEAPAGMPPSYLLGPSDAARASGLDLVPGETRWWSSFYCPATCRLSSASDDDGTILPEEHRERGLAVFAGFVQVRPQAARELRLALEMEDVWGGDHTGGLYRLRIHGQPLVTPAKITVVIRAPDGMDVVWTSEPMDVNGERAVWTGEAPGSRDLMVRFTKPFPARVWTRIWDFLSTPVIRF
jgi:hypothetical protein